MNKTSIEWVKNPDGTQGYTWNPITGCLNGCPYCYARKLANGRLKARYLANSNTAPLIMGSGTSYPAKFDYQTDDPFYPRFWMDRLWQPARQPEGKKKSLGIFAVDMGELFGDWIPQEWQNRVFKVIRSCHYHRFYLLTKQPQNLLKFSPFPENCWVGVTVTRDIYCTAALYYLHRVEAKIKFLSLEPLLMEIPTFEITSLLKMVGINWVIIGAQTKPTVYPKIEWVEEIVKACDKAGVKVFLKDNLRPLLTDALARKLIDRKQFFVHSIGHGGDLRQEIPE